MMISIERLDELVEKCIGENKTITSYTTRSLTKPGDNYGSVMLAVDIKVKGDGEEQVVHTVAKTPPTTEIQQKIFNTSVTFKNEIEFYRTIIPIFKSLQSEYGVEKIDYVPEFVGARFNLTNEDAIDSNAVLMLDNLVVKKFGTENRQIGFDFETSKRIVKHIANFHAVALALKLKKPEVFESRVKPFVDGFTDEETKESDAMKNVVKDYSELLINDDKYKHVIKKIEKLFGNRDAREVREPFATIVHADLWVNNIMTKRPLEVMILDFQVLRYQTPCDDLLFFLLSSTQDYVLKEHFEDLISYYYKELIDNLEKFECDTTPFSWEAFQEEIRHAKDEQFLHVLWMMYPIFIDEETVKDFSFDDTPKFTIADRQRERFMLILDKYWDKNWLNDCC